MDKTNDCLHIWFFLAIASALILVMCLGWDNGKNAASQANGAQFIHQSEGNDASTVSGIQSGTLDRVFEEGFEEEEQ